jgi:hypothetical protein
MVTMGQVRDMVRNSSLTSRLEQKYFLKSDSTSVDYNGHIVAHTDVGQGDTDQTRDGDNLFPLRLEIRLQVQLADTSNLVRVIFFRWIPSSTPVPGSIMQTTGNVLAPMSPVYHDYRQQYHVIYDKVFQLDTYHPYQMDVAVIKLPKQSIQFEAGGLTGTNKYYSCAITDSSAASHPAVVMYTKLWFTDA